MNYQVLEPYLDKNYSIFHALVSKEWLKVIQNHSFKTPYSVLTTPAILKYSTERLNLVD